MSLNGDYIQTSHGDLVVNIRRNGRNLTNDFLDISGGASLDGDVIIVPVNNNSKPKYQDVYTVLQAGAVVGNFDEVELVLGGPSLYGRSVVNGDGSVDVRVDARRIGHHYGSGHRLHSLGEAIDRLRFGGHFADMESLFTLVDGASFEAFDATLMSLTPQNAFQLNPMAVQYAQGLTLDLGARTAELRAGQRGVSQRSLLNGFRIAQAGADAVEGQQQAGLTSSARPIDMGERMGLFISGQGNLSAIGDEAYEGDRYNPGHLTAFSSADITIGADYRLSDNSAIGVATTFSRYLNRDGDAGATPMDHTGYGVMAFATTWDGAWFADAYVGVARHEYQMMRAPGFNMADGLDSAPGAVQSLAGVRGGWMFEPIEDLNIGPSLSLNYSGLNMDGYQEAGIADLALEVEGRTLTSVTVESALEFNYAPAINGRRALAAYGRVGFVTELGDGVDLVTARFIAAPDAPFDLGRDLDREWISSSFGLSYAFDNGMAANLEAAADTGRDQLDNTSIRAGFSFDF